MAQLTPNYGLSMPEATDDFKDFRASYNSNMGIIDNNLGGGGGGGGHTIVDENGSDMPAESKLQFTGNVSVTDDNVNGRTVVDILGGGGSTFGFAIDENNKLFEGTINNFNQSLSYTATEDAIVLCYFRGGAGTWQFLSINGVYIRLYGDGTNQAVSYSVPIRKGDVVASRSESYSESCYFFLSVYGIKQGTNGIYAPVVYSDTERVIGVWRDNKPLYQRTFVLSSTITVNGSGTLLPNDIQTALADVEIMVDSECARDSTYSAFISPYVYKGGGQWYILSADTWGNVKFITLRYTKTTDVAGSGDWNTDGVPTVHYDNTEKVIGTWIDGKPLYEKTIAYTPSGTISSNTTIANVPNAKVMRATEATAYNPSDNRGYVLPDVRANGGTKITYDNGDVTLVIIGDSWSSSWTFYVTVQYTKTTDT